MIKSFYSFLLLIFPMSIVSSSCSGNHSRNNDEDSIPSDSNVVASMSQVEEIVQESDPYRDEARKFLYQVFFDKNLYDISGNGMESYTPAMKENFKKYGVSSQLPEGYEIYSKDFQDTQKKFEAAERRAEDIIDFDWDILWDTQDIPSDFEMGVSSIEFIPTVIVKTNFNSGSKTFILVKENGKWRIDNMIRDGRDYKKEMYRYSKEY